MTDDKKVLVRFVEILSTLIIVATITSIAIPKYDTMKRGDTASVVLGDVDVLRTAVYAFYSDSAYFPPDSPTAAIPENLQQYLPRNFSPRRSWGTIEYKNWPMRAPTSGAPAADSAAVPNIVGATVTTNDPRIAAAAAAKSLTRARFIVGNKYTFLFFGA